MVWFYERYGKYIRFETRDFPDLPGQYELVQVLPDGTETVERFDSSDALYQRQQALERELDVRGWQGPYGRFL